MNKSLLLSANFTALQPLRLLVHMEVTDVSILDFLGLALIVHPHNLYFHRFW